MPEVTLSPNQEKVAQAFAAQLKVDLYATTINNWVDLTATDELAVEPYMPTFPLHYKSARAHALNWTQEVRPALVASLVAIQGLYDDFISDSEDSQESQGFLRKQLNTLKDKDASERDKESALADLRRGLEDIRVNAQRVLHGDPEEQLVGARDVLSKLEAFGANVGTDMERLYADYQDLQNLTAEGRELKTKLDEANADLEQAKTDVTAMAATTILGAALFLVGLAVTVVGAGLTPFSAGVTAPAVAVGVGLMVTGGTGVISGGIGWDAAVKRKRRAEKLVDSLETEDGQVTSAIKGASVLAGQGAFLSKSLVEVKSSMDVLIDKYKDFPEELRRIRDDAAKAATQSDYAQLDDDLTQLALDYSDLNRSLKSLLGALTNLTVEVDGQGESYFRKAA